MKKTTARTARPKRTDPEFQAAYIRLRTVLDGLEMNALRYCLETENVGTRTRRAKAIVAKVMPLLRKWQTEAVTPGEACDEGYVLCNGVCVPYQCVNPGGDMTISARKTKSGRRKK
jgi:hypothetical protein